MEDAKDVIRRTLDQAKAFLAQESPPKLTEADTKANFIEPIIAALGWAGIGVVTREYYVRNSQEFVDYVMAGPQGLLLAIEAKALQADLTDKHAAQLIQYCSVEGIEWAALTNGRELQFFNTFLKPDLGAKRVLRLDLLAFNTDAEFDALFAQLWQLSRERMTAPTGLRSWLNQRRLDAELRAILLTPGSPLLSHLRKSLAAKDIAASPQDLAQWFRRHLSLPLAAIPAVKDSEPPTPIGRPPVPTAADAGGDSHADERRVVSPSQPADLFGGSYAPFLPLATALRQGVDRRWPDTRWRELKYYVAAETTGKTFLAIKPRSGQLLLGLTLPRDVADPRLSDNAGASKPFNWSRITKVAAVATEADLDDQLFALLGSARARAVNLTEGAAYYGVTVLDLVDSGILREGTQLVLVRGGTDVARATVGARGEIIWDGAAYRSLSDRAFARLLGNQSLNGWTVWKAELPEGRFSLADLRERLLGSHRIMQSNDGQGVA